ncbi:MAG: hypothetical protein RIS70_959 [Planctomycetota bacterium]
MIDSVPEKQSPTNMAPTAFGFECGLAVVAGVIAWFLGVSPYRTFGSLSDEWPKILAWSLVGSLPPLGFLLLFPKLPGAWREELEIRLDRQILPLFALSHPAELLLVAASAGFAEELMFRGLIQDGIQQARPDAIGTMLGLVAGSLIFGVLHTVTRAYAVLATLMGLYLGGLLLITDSLLVPMLVHTVYDAVAFLILLRGWKERQARAAN